MVNANQSYMQHPLVTAVIGGIPVFGYTFPGTGLESGRFVVSPKKTLDDLVRAYGNSFITAGVAAGLVASAGLDPLYVARYLHESERLTFVLEVVQPNAQD